MAPLASAAANLVAALALAFVIAPATPLVPDVAERARYVREHLLEWRIAWGSWMLAAATLLWFYAWWREKVRAPRSAVGIALLGMFVDIFAETLLVVPDRYVAELAPLSFFLTGAIANGLYTIAGIQLTLATPLRTWSRTYAAFMWSAGLMLTLGPLISQPVIIAIATAELFVLFVPWCVWLWRRLA